MYAEAIHNRPSSSVAKFFDKRRRITWGIILLILLLTYLSLVFLPFPDYQQVSEIELGEEFFEMFEPPPMQVQETPTEHRESETVAGNEMPSEAELADVFNFTDLESIDPGGEIVQDTELFDELGGGLDALMDDFDDLLEGTVTPGLGDYITGDDESFDVAAGLVGLKSETETLGLENAAGTGISSEGSGGGRGGGIGSRVGTGKTVDTGTGVGVALKSFGEDDYSSQDFIYPLIEWMKAHPAPHPYTMKTFLEYQPGDLTSIIYFHSENRNFEMFLRCTETTRELAICIVEQTSATKLIDQGLSHRSHNLEEGTVTRGAGNEIVGTVSRRTSPTREKTEEFMSLFLSWWNNGNPVE